MHCDHIFVLTDYPHEQSLDHRFLHLPSFLSFFGSQLERTECKDVIRAANDYHTPALFIINNLSCTCMHKTLPISTNKPSPTPSIHPSVHQSHGPEDAGNRSPLPAPNLSFLHHCRRVSLSLFIFFFRKQIYSSSSIAMDEQQCQGTGTMVE
jgi:hypothetical protein